MTACVVTGMMLSSCASRPPATSAQTDARESAAPSTSPYPAVLPSGQPFAVRVLHNTYAPGEVRPARIRQVVGQPLFEKFAEDHNITVTDEEIAEFNKAMASRSKSDGASGSFPAFMARRFITNWKIDRELYRQYGGTVIFQQMNPAEPVGAYAAFFKASEKRGDFVIADEQLREDFWEYFEKEHDFVVPPEDIDFSTPWWTKLAAKPSVAPRKSK